MLRKLKILLVDQEGMLRDGLCAMINSEEELEVAGAITGAQTLRTIALAADPDVVIVDFPSPGGSEKELVEVARSRWPGVPILVLTLRRDNDSIESALRTGVDGYLLKTDPRAELVTAVHSVSEKKRYISPAIFDTVVSGFVTQQSTTRQASPDGLSEREREVMKLIAGGLRTREIAERLAVSHKTVEKHRTNLMRKLGVRTAAAVAAYAITNGYLIP